MKLNIDYYPMNKHVVSSELRTDAYDISGALCFMHEQS